MDYRGKNCGVTNGTSHKEEYAYTNFGAPSGKQLTVTKKLANGILFHCDHDSLLIAIKILLIAIRTILL